MPSVEPGESEKKDALDALVARVRALPRLRAFALHQGRRHMFDLDGEIIEKMLEPHVANIRRLSLDLDGFAYSRRSIVGVFFFAWWHGF